MGQAFLRGRKVMHTLRSHLIHRSISRVRGITKMPRKVQQKVEN